MEKNLETGRIGGQVRMEEVTSGREVSCESESEHIIRHSALRNGLNGRHRSVRSEIRPRRAVVLNQRRCGGATVVVSNLAKFSGLDIDALHAKGKSPQNYPVHHSA